MFSWWKISISKGARASSTPPKPVSKSVTTAKPQVRNEWLKSVKTPPKTNSR